jgi:hypothetical protein
MNWLHLLAYLFAGAFLINAVPHLVSGLMGRPFQTPWAKPRGPGQSSSIQNVLWGFCNLAIGYLLVCRVGDFDLRANDDVIALLLGALLMGLGLAWRFGQFNGGNNPGGS